MQANNFFSMPNVSAIDNIDGLFIEIFQIKRMLPKWTNNYKLQGIKKDI